MKNAIVTLTTDFGIQDTYVGVMKGAILGIAPEARIVDLTHGIRPGDIRSAAFSLAGAIAYFPEHSVHVVVVDPGVGGSRRAIAIETSRSLLVGPDNGVFTLALRREPAKHIVHLTHSKFWLPQVSDTFHGRDVFGPVAAHLALGVPLQDLGPEIRDLADAPTPEPAARPDGALEGEIILIDHFGNCITNIPASLLKGRKSVTFRIRGGRIGGLVRSYSDVAPGSLLAVVGSSGFVEIAVRDGSAAERLGIRVGSEVLVI